MALGSVSELKRNSETSPTFSPTRNVAARPRSWGSGGTPYMHHATATDSGTSHKCTRTRTHWHLPSKNTSVRTYAHAHAHAHATHTHTHTHTPARARIATRYGRVRGHTQSRGVGKCKCRCVPCSTDPFGQRRRMFV